MSRRIRIAGWSTTVFRVLGICKRRSKSGSSCGSGGESVSSSKKISDPLWGRLNLLPV